jgi:two-component system response regulator YesN
MIKLLIVEDEQTIREGLVQTIDWETYGIEVCGQAGNGLEALERLQHSKPDIILTDIRMPKMDGLEFIRRARETNLDFEVILLSGYNDFEYAKQGIQLGALDYILKPCRPEDLLKFVLQAKRTIEEKQERKSAYRELMQTWHKNIPLLKSQALSGWALHPKQPLETRIALLKELSMSIQAMNLHIGIVRFDQSGVPSKYDEDDQEIIRYAALNIIHETLSPVYKGQLEAFKDSNDLLWCANIHHTPSLLELKTQMAVLQNNLERYLKVSVSIGVGNRCQSIDQIHQSYLEALEAVESRFYKGRGGIYFYSEVHQTYKKSGGILNDPTIVTLESDMINLIHTAQYADAIDKTETWLDYIRSCPQYGRKEVNVKASAFIVQLQKLAHEHKVTTFEWKNNIINWMEQLPMIETFDDLSTIIKKIIQSLVEILKSQNPIHRTVQAALDIIHQRYHTNLTLDAVAKEVFVSNTYLSSLFKQELGINFLDYLHSYRVDLAKNLLRDHYKVYAVARMVGYQEERHFSSTFKKWTGLTPSQYQRNP